MCKPPYDYLAVQKALIEAERMARPLAEWQRQYETIAQQAAHMVEMQEKAFRSLPPPSSIIPPSIASLASQIVAIEGSMIASSAYENASKATSAIVSLVQQQEAVDRQLQSSMAINAQWQSSVISLIQMYPEHEAKRIALEAHQNKMLLVSMSAQRYLAQLESPAIALAKNLGSLKVLNANKSLIALSSSYASLLSSFDPGDNAITNYPPFVSSRPPIEVLLSANLSIGLTNGASERKQQDIELIESIDSELDSSIQEVLASVNAELVPIWVGARDAMASSNPARKRHVSVSVRELITHVLHQLAPDNEILIWSSDPKDYHEKRPTRKARMKYICRKIDSGAFKQFVEKDIISCLAFIELFQTGTHKVSIDFTEAQLQCLLVRAEGLIKFLAIAASS